MTNWGRTGTAVEASLLILASMVVTLILVASVAPISSDAPRPAAAAGAVPQGSTALREPAPSAVLPAIPTTTWINVTSSGPGVSPPPGYGSSTAYDPLHHVTLLFGGCLTPACPSNQTWVFGPGGWSNVTSSSGAPPAREYASMDFDANMGGILLFGGLGSGSAPLNDTWLYQGGRWTNLSYVGAAPSARYGAGMAFDPAQEENGSVLYGGCVPAFLGVACTNDTWVWSGWSGWTSLAASFPPPAVGFFGLVFDPGTQALVLFGGCAGVLCLGTINETWELVSGQWSEVGGAVHPSARSGPAMVYDPAAGEVLLFGGFDVSEVLDADTWSFTGSTWSQLHPSSSPSAREDAALTLDPTGSTPILVGGSASVSENDTWAFELPPSTSVTPAVTTAEAGVPVALALTVTGGTAPFELHLAFGDGSDALLSGAAPPFYVDHRFSAPGTFTAVVNVTDAVGAKASATATPVLISTGPTISASASPSLEDAGLPVRFTAWNVSGGSPPLVYAWNFGDGSNGSGASLSHAYRLPGRYAVGVNGTDTLGGTGNASLSVTVAPDPTVSVAPVPSTPSTDDLIVLGAPVIGGVGPFSFHWTFGDGNSSVLPTALHEYADPGRFLVTVWVNDSVGGTTHASLNITVHAPGSSGGSGIAGLPLWFWGGASGLAAGGAGGTAALLRRSRPDGP